MRVIISALAVTAGLGLMTVACAPMEETAAGHVNRGIRHHEMGYLGLAIANYSRAIELDPSNALAYNKRGQAYYQQQIYSWAIADLNRNIELNPNYTDAYSNRGMAYYYLSQSDKDGFRWEPHHIKLGQAIADFNRAIARNPSLAAQLNPWLSLAYYDRGLFYYSVQGEEVLAEVDFNKSLELNPDYSDTYLARGLLFRQQGKLDLAEADFSKALDLNSDLVIPD